MHLADKLMPSVTNVIRLDHAHMLAHFHHYRPDSGPRVKRGLVDAACLTLEIHTQLEEEIFYPALREVHDSDMLKKSVPEHNEMHRVIALLRSMEPTDVRFDETFMELMRDVIHHVADEETVLLPEAERLLPEHLGQLGLRMTKRRVQLGAPRTGEMAMNMARALPGPSVAVTLGFLAAGLWLGMRIARA